MGRHADQYERASIWRRVFGAGEDPLGWGLVLFRTRGFTLRIHLIFLAYALLEVIRSLTFDASGPVFVLTMLAGFLVASSFHECARLIAAKLVGGSMEEIVLWPLGGLRDAEVPDRKAWIVPLAGIGGSLFLGLLLAGVLVSLGVGIGGVVFNPFESRVVLTTEVMGVSGDWWLTFAWWVYFADLIVLAFNAFLPALPLDAGRALLAMVERRKPRPEAVRLVSRVGLISCACLAVGAVVFEEFSALAVAGVGAWACWQEKRRSFFLEEPQDAEWDMESRARSLRTQARAKDQAELRQEELEIDRLLEKISVSGMDSLTREERRKLEEATSRRQGT